MKNKVYRTIMFDNKIYQVLSSIKQKKGDFSQECVWWSLHFLFLYWLYYVLLVFYPNPLGLKSNKLIMGYLNQLYRGVGMFFSLFAKLNHLIKVKACYTWSIINSSKNQLRFITLCRYCTVDITAYIQ